MGHKKLTRQQAATVRLSDQSKSSRSLADHVSEEARVLACETHDQQKRR
jgi:hypothetical protein